MSFSLQRNTGSSQVRNPGGSKNNFAAAYFQIIFGLVPVCGFGTFASGCKFNSLSWWNPSSIGGADYSGLVFNDIWPNVYTTLTEVITTQAGTDTRTIVYSQDLDDFITYTDPNTHGNFDINSFQSPSGATVVVSGGGTVVTITWLAGSPATLITYVATVSNQLNANTSWATWTAKANALIADWQTSLGLSFPAFNDMTWQDNFFGMPPIPGGCFAWALYPFSASPGWGGLFGGSLGAPSVSAGLGIGAHASEPFVVGAANGIAIRCYNFYAPGNQNETVTSALPDSNAPLYIYVPDTPVSAAYEQDEPSPASIAGTAVIPNCGYVLSATSRWNLLGLPTAYPVLTDNNTNHMGGTWSQGMTVPSGAQPYFSAVCNFFTPGSRGITTFTPTDVSGALTAAGFTPPYGMIGFRNP